MKRILLATALVIWGVAVPISAQAKDYTYTVWMTCQGTGSKPIYVDIQASNSGEVRQIVKARYPQCRIASVGSGK